MRATVRALAAATVVSLVAGLAVASPATAAGSDLETTWASSGVLALSWDFGPVRDTSVIASTPDGELLLAGGDDNAHACVTRLTPAGELDPVFSSTPGLIGSVCDFGSQDPGRFVAMQAVGRSLVAAAELPAARRIVRLNEWGGIPGNQDLESSYSGAGGRILDVAALSDGRTAVLETRSTDGPGWVTLLESSGGQFVGDWEVPSIDGSHRFRPQQVLPGPGGKVLLVGELERDSGPITAVLRTDDAGQPDSSFSGDGFSDGPPSSTDRPGRGALGFGGTVVLAAVRGADVSVRRITSSGALDATFTASGRSAVLPSGAVGISAVVRRADGRFFLVFGGDDSTTSVQVARLTTSGALDTTFSNDGFASHEAGVGHVRAAISATLGLDGDLYVLADDPSAADDPEVLLFDGSHDTAPPAPAMTGPASTWNLSSTVRLSWSVTDASPLITSDLRTWRAATGSVLPATPQYPLTASTARTHKLVKVSGGTTVCASARARDAVGQLSGWSSQRCTAVPLTPSQLTRGAGVTSKAKAGTYAGRVLSATTKGSVISRTGVKAKRVALVATTCPSCGKVKVYLGSRLLGSVSLRSPTTRTKVVLDVATLAGIRSGKVRIKVASTGKKVLVEGLGVSKV
jgi:uncharacterized delta-60 repeat protein